MDAESDRVLVSLFLQIMFETFNAPAIYVAIQVSQKEKVPRQERAKRMASRS